MLNVNNADVYTDFNGLAKLKSQAKNDSKEALQEVAKQFESIFLNSVLKSMRDAKLADGAMDNDQSKFYREMYDQQLAVHLAGSPGVGLADLIVKQLGHDQPEDNKKMDLEDYLNRSSGAAKSVSRPSNAPAYRLHDREDERAVFKSYLQENRPINEVGNIPLKKDAAKPINSAKEFVRKLQPYAEQAARELGVDPKIILAQAALETGWGRSLIKTSNGDNSFNLFNIKADKSWQGKQAHVDTLEFDQGVAKKMKSGFRTYESFEESFQDYVNLIKNSPRYSDALKHGGNAENYMRELQQAGYATDPNYANKIMNIYRGNTISEFEPDLMTASLDDQSKSPL